MKELSVFQVVLLASFGALAISGMLVFALLVSSGGANAIGAVTIWGTLDPNAFTVVLRQAAETENRFSQVTYVQKDQQEYERLLTEALASGTGPDLFLLRQDYVVRNEGKIVPIPYDNFSRSQFEDTFVEAAEPYLAGGGVLGIPIVVDPLVLYWNRDMLSAAGFAQPPRYWDELPDLAQRVVKKDESGRIVKAAVAFGEYQNVDNAKDILVLLILQAGGSITQRDNTGRLLPTLSARTAGAASQATESALRFYTEFADPSKIDYSWNRSLPESRAAFAAGDLALYVGYASEASAISRTNPNLNFAVASVPQSRVAGNALNVARVYALAISRTSARPSGAITVASIMGDTAFAQSLSFALALPSARRDVLAQSSADEDELGRRGASAKESD